MGTPKYGDTIPKIWQNMGKIWGHPKYGDTIPIKKGHGDTIKRDTGTPYLFPLTIIETKHIKDKCQE